MNAQSIKDAIHAEFVRLADLNSDGKLSKADIAFAAHAAAKKIEEKAQSNPKVAVILTAVVSIGVTSMIWAMFCR